MLRYSALLQRHDSAHVEVAQGDDKAAVIAAATAVYTTLVPTILAQGELAIARERRDPNGDEGRKTELANGQQYGWLVAQHLSAQEWGVGVYDRMVDPKIDGMQYAPEPRDTPELIFWVGATLDTPEW